MVLLQTLRFILNHPLNRSRKALTVARYVRWQIGSRLLPGPVAVPYVEDSVLLVEPGMTGATGAVYCGLHEYHEMAFLLHLLRAGDLFFDIGANVGSYTVLAGACGARVVACEPIDEAFETLKRNVLFNGFQGIEVLNVGVADTVGARRFSTALDTMNRVVHEEDFAGPTREVPVETVDGLRESFGAPVAIKTDVEGYELKVLSGARETLLDQRTIALIVEMNGPDNSFGSNDKELVSMLSKCGFCCAKYDPSARSIEPGVGITDTGNQIFVRDFAIVRDRLLRAKTRLVAGVPI